LLVAERLAPAVVAAVAAVEAVGADAVEEQADAAAPEVAARQQRHLQPVNSLRQAERQADWPVS